jgi:hypothetical protein
MAHTTTPMNSGTLRKALNINTDFVAKHQTPIKDVYPENEEIGHKIKTLTNYYHNKGNFADKNKLSFEVYKEGEDGIQAGDLRIGRVKREALESPVHNDTGEAWEEKKNLIEDLINLQAIDFRKWAASLFDGTVYIGSNFIYTEEEGGINTRQYYKRKDDATAVWEDTPSSDKWEPLNNLDSGTLSTYAAKEANFQTNIVRNGVIAWALERLGNDMEYEQEAWNEYYDVIDSGIDMVGSAINLVRASFPADLLVSEEQCLVRLENGHTVLMPTDEAKGMNVIGELSLTNSDKNLLENKLKNMKGKGNNNISLIGSEPLRDIHDVQTLKSKINKGLSGYRVHLYQNTEDTNKISYYYRIQEDLPAVSGEVYLVNNDWRYVARDIYHNMSKIDISGFGARISDNFKFNNFRKLFSNFFDSEGAELAKSINSFIRQITEYRFSSANRTLTHAADCTDTVPAIMQQNSSILAGGHYIDSSGYVLDVEEMD